MNSFYSQELEFKHLHDSIIKKIPQLKNTMDLNVSKVELSEIFNLIAFENELNIEVDRELNNFVNCNFTNVRVADLLEYLITAYNLEVTTIGNILKIKKTKPLQLPIKIKVLDIAFKDSNQFLSYNLKNDTLSEVCRKITALTGKNIQFEQNISAKLLSGYVQNRPVKNSLEMLALSNNLALAEFDDFWFLSEIKDEKIAKEIPFRSTKSFNSELNLVKNSKGNVEANFDNQSIDNVVQKLISEFDLKNVQYGKFDGTVSMKVNDIPIDGFLNLLFAGTKASYKLTDSTYLFGDIKHQGLNYTKLVRLENRTIESLLEVLPKEIIGQVEIFKFI